MNWKVLQQLDELMNKGDIPDKISKIPYISRLISMEYISQNKNRLRKTEAFNEFYLEKHRDLFNSFNDLIVSNDLVHTNFELNELKSLLKVSNDRKYMVDQDKSLKEISTIYFNDAKYLKRESQLTTAVCKILGISSIPFDEHDQ